MWLFLFKLIPAWFADYALIYRLWIAVAGKAYDEEERKLPLDKSR